MKKAEILSDYLPQMSLAVGLPTCLKLLNLRGWGNTVPPTVSEEQHDWWNWCQICGPDNTHPRALRGLMLLPGHPPCISKPWWSSAVSPQQWENGNITPVFKKGMKGRSRELQNNETLLFAWICHGEDPHGSNFKTHTRQEGFTRADPTWPFWQPSMVDRLQGPTREDRQIST